MVKSVSSCCVRGSRVLSNPVTYELIIHEVYWSLTGFYYNEVLGYFDELDLTIAMSLAIYSGRVGHTITTIIIIFTSTICPVNVLFVY